jgi:hypothetical protein
VVEVEFAEPAARGLILGAYGVTLAGFLLVQAFGNRRLITSGAMARGTVVGAEQDRSWSLYGTGSTTYNPMVRFTTPDGRTVTFTSAVGYSREPDVGGAVDVRYLRDDPEQAEIDRATLWVLPAAVGVLGGVGLLVAGVPAYSASQVTPAVVETVVDPETSDSASTVAGPATSDPIPTVAGPAASDPVPEPRPPPKVATGRIGDKLTIEDEHGDAQLEVTVTRVTFIRGDAFNQPQCGLYMGAYVKGHALADEQFLLSFSARVRGHLYDQAFANPLAFDPRLGGVLLDKGERAAGWLVFDVPARHGQLVLRNVEEQTVAVWRY